MKTVLAVLILSAAANAQRVVVPTVEQCRADQKVWSVGKDTLHRPFRDAVKRGAEMSMCRTVDPPNASLYTAVIEDCDINREKHLVNFVQRHGMVEEFNKETAVEAGLTVTEN